MGGYRGRKVVGALEQALEQARAALEEEQEEETGWEEAEQGEVE